MKGWLCFSAVIALTASTVANANIAVTDGNSSSFDIAGEIQPECKVANQSSTQATQLNLQSQDPQAAANVAIWCNTGQDTASTTYSSANQGFMVSDEGNRIAYNLTVENDSSELNLATPQTLLQQAGTGSDGQSNSQQVSILPQINGFESAGAYQDTIQVTVSYN